VPNFQPKRPLSSPPHAPPCDMQLPMLAMEHRIKNQLVSAAAFSRYNVSVWKLSNHEYVVEHNETIGELEEKHGVDPDNPAKVGFHAEVLVCHQVYGRRDVLEGKTLVAQIFTERIPCSECRSLLLFKIPYFREIPTYYYLTYHDRDWQKKQADGKWGVFLMNCYRFGAT